MWIRWESCWVPSEIETSICCCHLVVLFDRMAVDPNVQAAPAQLVAERQTFETKTSRLFQQLVDQQGQQSLRLNQLQQQQARIAAMSAMVEPFRVVQLDAEAQRHNAESRQQMFVEELARRVEGADIPAAEDMVDVSAESLLRILEMITMR